MEKEKMKEKKQNSILELFKPYAPEAVISRILEGKGREACRVNEVKLL